MTHERKGTVSTATTFHSTKLMHQLPTLNGADTLGAGVTLRAKLSCGSHMRPHVDVLSIAQWRMECVDTHHSASPNKLLLPCAVCVGNVTSCRQDGWVKKVVLWCSHAHLRSHVRVFVHHPHLSILRHRGLYRRKHTLGTAANTSCTVPTCLPQCGEPARSQSKAPVQARSAWTRR